MTSKRYEKASFKALVSLIQSKRFALAPWSLPTLLDIARHTTIAQKIEVIRLSRCLLHFPNWEQEADRDLSLARRRGEDEDEVEERLDKDEETFCKYHDPQQSFIDKGAKEMLSMILSLLPNLKILALGDWEVPIEDTYNDWLNYFDKDMQAHLRCHGFPKQEAEEYVDAYHPANDGFKEVDVVLSALSHARKPIESLFVRSFSLYDHYIHVQRVTRLLAPLRDGLVQAFKNLRTLHLSLGDSVDYELEEPDEVEDEDRVDQESIRWLADFIELTPQVEDVSLSFFECESATKAFHEFASRASLSRLKKFGLHFIYMNSEDLATLLFAHAPTLQAVTLRNCGFTDMRWSDFLSDTFQSFDVFEADVTLARLCEIDHSGDSDWEGSVLFDTDSLADCCNLRDIGWEQIKRRDCKHVNKTVQRDDIPHLKMALVDQSDVKRKEGKEGEDST